MDKILIDSSRSAVERHYLFVHEFFRTEFEEADLRRAIQATGVNFEKTKSYKDLREKGHRSLRVFMKELIPKVRNIDFEVDFYMTTIATIAEDVSSRVDNEHELLKWSRGVSDMLLWRFQA